MIRSLKEDRPSHACIPFAPIVSPKDLELLTKPKMLCFEPRNEQTSQLIWTKMLEEYSDEIKWVDTVQLINFVPNVNNASLQKWWLESSVRELYLNLCVGKSIPSSLSGWLTKPSLHTFFLQLWSSFTWQEFALFENSLTHIKHLDIMASNIVIPPHSLSALIYSQILHNLLQLESFSLILKRSSYVELVPLQIWFTHPSCRLKRLSVVVLTTNQKPLQRDPFYDLSIFAFQISTLTSLRLSLQLSQETLEKLVPLGVNHPTLSHLNITGNKQTTSIPFLPPEQKVFTLKEDSALILQKNNELHEKKKKS
jgi:hypothetical protein